MSSAIAPGGNRGAAGAGRKHLRVLLPFTRDTLRIPNELAAEIGAEEAFIVTPFGRGRVRRVSVGQDGDDAFLGCEWKEFADACSADFGWFLVLRHHGGGVLTLKVFDTTYCLMGLATEIPPVQEPVSRTDASRMPQFISLLGRNSMGKLLIPPEFVENHIPKGHMNGHIAILFGPIGKIYQVGLEMNGTGTFFSGGWSEFLALHRITKDNSLLLRYEGNLTFTVKVFAPEGCQIQFKQNGIGMQQISALPSIENQQELPSPPVQKCKTENDQLCSEEQKELKASTTSLNKAQFQTRSLYVIGTSSWIKKVVNNCTLHHHLSLAKGFCNAIGLLGHCTITLKTSMDNTKSWEVHGHTTENSSYLISTGWKRFCQENNLQEGDTCTFYVVKTTLWHVVITRCMEQQENPSASSSKRKNGSDISSSEEQKGPNGPMTSSNTASSRTRCAFEIGPPARIRKEINASTIRNLLSLPLAFCKAIGLRERCTVTLKTSMSSIASWEVRVVPYRYCNHLTGPGWKRFCLENMINEGDVCTFNVVDTELWLVDIAHQ